MLQKQNYERQECRFVSFLAGIVGNGSTMPSKSFTLESVYCKTVSWEMTTVFSLQAQSFEGLAPLASVPGCFHMNSSIFIYSGNVLPMGALITWAYKISFGSPYSRAHPPDATVVIRVCRTNPQLFMIFAENISLEWVIRVSPPMCFRYLTPCCSQ